MCDDVREYKGNCMDCLGAAWRIGGRTHCGPATRRGSAAGAPIAAAPRTGPSSCCRYRRRPPLQPRGRLCRHLLFWIYRHEPLQASGWVSTPQGCCCCTCRRKGSRRLEQRRRSTWTLKLLEPSRTSRPPRATWQCRGGATVPHWWRHCAAHGTPGSNAAAPRR